MAEKPKGFMHEAELAIVRQKETLDKLTALQASVTKLAIILRDLVYIEARDGDGGEESVLADHQAALDEIIGATANEP